jgi:hypothetical protein
LRRGAVSIRDHDRHGTRFQPGWFAVGATGEDNRHARARHDTAGVGIRLEGELLCQHVGGLEVRHKRYIGPPNHMRDNAFLRDLGANHVLLERSLP